MNIKEAKEQIKNAITAYFTKDEFGNYIIPIEKQRPVFLMGPPGIGKTAIMEQVASELGVGLISYSMTHHTRQSALGLPFIEKKSYGGKEYSISEYTMSEIIASVYEMMENTGLKEGILFLDEINCVSETLAPSMLQFLQYKIFGRHRVPDGWIVVTAGNPPEFNNSVREFDIVTWDRLKRVDVEPDYKVWKEYAYKTNVHPSIITYLDIKKNNFYKIETTVDGKSFVTARGWSDLSDMIKLYEQHGIEVKETLIQQYLQNKTIAKDFAIYYDLFNKYKSDYQVDKILSGTESEAIKIRAKSAKFDERLSLLGLIIDPLTNEAGMICNGEEIISGLRDSVRIIRTRFLVLRSYEKCIDEQVKSINKKIDNGKISSSLTRQDENVLRNVIAILNNIIVEIKEKNVGDENDAFEIIKKMYNLQVKKLKENVVDVGKKYNNAFKFCEEVYEDGQEMLILVTELTMNYYSARYISRYGCEEYFKHNKELLFYERQKEIISEINDLEEI